MEIEMTKKSDGSWVAKIGDRVLAKGKVKMTVFQAAQSKIATEEAKAIAPKVQASYDLESNVINGFFNQK